jgi:hypothetical protein
MQPVRRLIRVVIIVSVLGLLCSAGTAAARRSHPHVKRCAGRQHHHARHSARRRCRARKLKSIAPIPRAQTLTPGETTPQQFAIGSQAASAPAPFRFFSPSSFWNVPVAEDAPLDPKSAEIVKAFSTEMANDQVPGKYPWINTTNSSVPIYTVPADQPSVAVTLEPTSKAPALQAAWQAVPLPAGAQPAAGPEKVLVVWQPSTDRLWEFWRMEAKEDGWHATWGGAMQDVSSDPGFYGPWAWFEAKSGWGVSASSLELLGGLISMEDLALGQINHAIAIAVPNVRAGVYASPAQRTDGKSSNPLSLPEGAHLRLDPHLDLQALHLPHVGMMIAQAAQRYGFVVRDGAPNLSIYAQDPTPTGANPYAGPTGYFEGKYPRELLAGFPWSHLQLLKMELHTAP